MRSLFEKRSLFDRRIRRQDHRVLTLEQIAESREIRVVPTLLPLVAADETVAPHVAAVIAELVGDVTAVDIVGRRVRSLSDAKARGNLLRLFLEAPKWEAPVFLLEMLTDPDDGVRTLAVRLVDRWIETFNHNQTQPTPMQLQRIGALLDSVASRMPEKTARMLRFSIKAS